MSDDEIKAVEARGYSRGYARGRRRLETDIASQTRLVARQDFLDQAFLAALPTCIETGGWTKGGKPIASLEDRTSLAWDFAEYALKTRRFA